MSRLIAAALVMLAVLMAPAPVDAASRAEIDADVTATLQKFYARVPGGQELVQRATGVLVFPSVVKAGIGVGGEYGEGALRTGNVTLGYYNTVSASVGFQLGVQARSVIILFMTPQSFDSFQNKKGWKIGVDGSVALVTLGAGGAVDTNTIKKPVLGFILDNKGLMYNLTLEGSKITRIER